MTASKDFSLFDLGAGKTAVPAHLRGKLKHDFTGICPEPVYRTVDRHSSKVVK